MNERSENYPEHELKPQDHVMKIRGFFEDAVGLSEFQTWKTALKDFVEVRQLEEERKVIAEKVEKTQSPFDKAKTVTRSLLWQWKMEDNQKRGKDSSYRRAFMEISTSTMYIEMAYEQEGHKNPTQAADKELEELKEYVTRLAKQE